MDDMRFNVLFNSIPVISGQLMGYNERLYAIEPRSHVIPAPSGLESQDRWISKPALNPLSF